MRGLLLIALLTACAGAPPSRAGEAPGEAAQDAAAYAVASCFAAQPQPFLQDQGNRWAGAIIQRGAGPLETWIGIAEAVKAELASSGIKQGQGDGPSAATIALPVMTCGEIAAAPAVRTALARAIASLEPAYRARPTAE